MTAPLQMTISTLRSAASTTADTVNYALVRLAVPEKANLGETQAEMVLVLDRSGSMFQPVAGARPIDKVIQATRAVVDALRPRDRLGIVVFDDRAETLCPLTSGELRKQLSARLDEFQRWCDTSGGGGGTEMAPALREAVTLVRSQARDARAARIVVLTDGQAGDNAATLNYVRTLERQSIAALGFGDFDFNFMTEVCSPSKGLCEPVGDQDPSKVREKFMDELKVAQDTVASNLRLRVRATDYVRLRESYLTCPRATYLGPAQLGPDRVLTIDLPILERQYGIEAVFDLVHVRRDPGTYSAAEVTVMYDVPSLGLKDQELVDNVVVEYTADQRKQLEVDNAVQAAYERGRNEKLRIRLEEAMKDGDTAQANKIMASIRGGVKDKAFVQASARMVKGEAGAAREAVQASRRLPPKNANP